MVRVKICGITNLEDALLAEQSGADALGFIFSGRSPRCIKPALAKKIISSLGPFVSRVGVFMNQEKEDVSKAAGYAGLDTLQFHGRESAAYCNSFRPKYKVIKVFFPGKSRLDISKYAKADAWMFDIPYQEKKKEKKVLSRETLGFIKKIAASGRRVIASGGLSCANITSLKKYGFYGVDVASGVEELVGKKDKKLVKSFIRKAKNENTR